MMIKKNIYPFLFVITFLIGTSLKLFYINICSIIYVNTFLILSLIFLLLHLKKNVFLNKISGYKSIGFKLSIGKFLGILGFTLAGISVKNKILDGTFSMYLLLFIYLVLVFSAFVYIKKPQKTKVF